MSNELAPTNTSIESIGMKRCSGCGQDKPLSDFHRCKRNKDGLNRLCKPCNYRQSRAWESAHPERRRERYLANPDPTIDRNLRRLYGLSLSEYEAIFAAQSGTCAICGEPPPASRRLDVDHSHITGAIRGLLCMHCNLALGHLNESLERATALAAYLARHMKDER